MNTSEQCVRPVDTAKPDVKQSINDSHQTVIRVLGELHKFVDYHTEGAQPDTGAHRAPVLHETIPDYLMGALDHLSTQGGYMVELVSSLEGKLRRLL